MELDAVQRAFLARSASDVGVPAEIEEMMGTAMTPTQSTACPAPRRSRRRGLRREGSRGSHARAPRPRGRLRGGEARRQGPAPARACSSSTASATRASNPNRRRSATPAPARSRPRPSRRLRPSPSPRSRASARSSPPRCAWSAPGAGGGGHRRRATAAGRSVRACSEMGPYRNEADFDQRGSRMLDLYLGGGLVASEDGSIAVLPGSCLGGVRRSTARTACARRTGPAESAAHGVEGIDSRATTAASTRSWSASRRGRR